MTGVVRIEEPAHDAETSREMLAELGRLGLLRSDSAMFADLDDTPDSEPLAPLVTGTDRRDISTQCAASSRT